MKILHVKNFELGETDDDLSTLTVETEDNPEYIVKLSADAVLELQTQLINANSEKED